MNLPVLRISGARFRLFSIRPFWWWVGLGLWGLIPLLVLVAIGMRARPDDLIADLTARIGLPISTASDFRTATRIGPAPDFHLSLFDGGSFHLADQRGKVVAVNFWASWCPPCRAEAPRLEAAYQTYRDRGVIFVGVDIQDAPANARAFITEFGVSYPNGPDDDQSITRTYAVDSIPVTFFVDREGQIRRRWLGEIQPDQLTAFIEEALR